MESCSKFFSRFRPLVHIPLIIGGVILMAGLAFLFGFIVMLLWNWLMPEIFGLSTITYWQAWGLVILSHILFKAGSWHHDHNHDHGRKKSRNGFKAEFKRKFRKAFEKEFEKEFDKKCEKENEEDESVESKQHESEKDKSVKEEIPDVDETDGSTDKKE